jgi:hypothetical protein
MSIDRIFAELNSRQFRFVVDGKQYELPHLNSLKSVINEAYGLLDENGNVANDRLMIFLFNNSGNLQWATKLRTVKIKEARVIYAAWQEWSGFELGKYFGVLSIVDKYLAAIELDLFEKNMTYSSFFELSPRSQINIIASFGQDMESNLFTKVNNYKYRWSVLKEFAAQQLEVFVMANSEEGAEKYHAERPYDASEHIEISDEQQSKIMEKLTPIKWD